MDETMSREQLLEEIEHLRARVTALENMKRAAPPLNPRDMRIVQDWLAADASYRLILQQVPAVVWAVDPALRFTLSMGAGLRAVGLKPGEILGQSLPEFLQTRDNGHVVLQAHRRALAGESANWETVVLGRLFESHAEPLRDAAGRIVGVVGVAWDITERRAATEALRESNERFFTVARQAPVGIFLCDATGTCLYANERFCRYAGLTENEIRGSTWARVVHPDDLTHLMQEWERSVRTNTPYHVECRIVTPTGALRWLIVETVAARDDKGAVKYYVATCTDITERRATEAALRQIENLAATGRIAARVAHEINNPLAGIKNSFLLIKDAVQPQHPYFSYVDRIEREIDRIARIVGQMLDMYRPHQESPRTFDVAEAVRDVVSFLEPHAGEGRVAIEMNFPPALLTVVMPESWLRQVLYNVLQNAIDASPPGGTVRIAAQVDGQLVLRISDQGAGIDPETALQIFEPFYTTKQGTGNRSGLGLGLSTSRSLVEAMGGRITFETQKGRGTTFQIAIPLRPQVTE